MILRNALVATAVGAVALVWGGLAVADEYQADDFLSLDLSKAVLSPRPLGPPARFAPGPPDVTIERDSRRAYGKPEPAAEPKVVVRSARATHPRADKARHVAQPRLLARTKFGQHHGSPLDAQAFDARVSDARIQVWPCKSGGICNWKR
jgi:hypothetical protein